MSRYGWVRPRSRTGWFIFVPAVILIVVGVVVLFAGPEAIGGWLVLSGAVLSLCAQYADYRSSRSPRT